MDSSLVPDDAWIHILSFLSAKELFQNIAVVGKHFHQLLHSNQLWHDCPFHFCSDPPVDLLRRFEIRHLIINSTVFPYSLLTCGAVNLASLKSIVMRSSGAFYDSRELVHVLKQAVNLETLVISVTAIRSIRWNREEFASSIDFFPKLRELEVNAYMDDVQDMQLVTCNGWNVRKLVVGSVASQRISFHPAIQPVSLTTDFPDMIEKHGNNLRYLTLKSGSGPLTLNQIRVCEKTLVRLILDDFYLTAVYSPFPNVSHLEIKRCEYRVVAFVLECLVNFNSITHFCCELTSYDSKLEALPLLTSLNSLRIAELINIPLAVILQILSGNDNSLHSLKISYLTQSKIMFNEPLFAKIPTSVRRLQIKKATIVDSECDRLDLDLLELEECTFSQTSILIQSLAVRDLRIHDCSIKLAKLSTLVSLMSQTKCLNHLEYDCITNDDCDESIDLLLNSLQYSQASNASIKLTTVDAFPSKCKLLNQMDVDIELAHAMTFEDIVLLTVACHNSALVIRIQFDVYYTNFNYKDTLENNLQRFKSSVANVIENRLVVSADHDHHKQELIHYYQNMDWNNHKNHPLYTYLKTIETKLTSW